MQRPFVKECISIVVADVHDSPDSLHNSEEAIQAMNTQLKSLGMEDLVVDTDAIIDEVCMPFTESLPPLSPILSSTFSSIPTTRSSLRSSTQGSSQSSARMSLLVHATPLDHQKHQLALEEERCIASEIALSRLRQKTEVVFY